MKISKNRLLSSINDAFDRGAYPEGLIIVDEEMNWDGSEEHDIATFLKGRRWQDLHFHELLNEYPGDYTAIVSFLTDEAFVYYLPAFLVICLNECDDDDILITSLSYLLVPRKSNERQPAKAFQSKMTILNQKQQSCVERFLQYFDSVLPSFEV